MQLYFGLFLYMSHSQAKQHQPHLNFCSKCTWTILVRQIMPYPFLCLPIIILLFEYTTHLCVSADVFIYYPRFPSKQVIHFTTLKYFPSIPHCPHSFIMSTSLSPNLLNVIQNTGSLQLLTTSTLSSHPLSSLTSMPFDSHPPLAALHNVIIDMSHTAWISLYKDYLYRNLYMKYKDHVQRLVLHDIETSWIWEFSMWHISCCRNGPYIVKFLP